MEKEKKQSQKQAETPKNPLELIVDKELGAIRREVADRLSTLTRKVDNELIKIRKEFLRHEEILDKVKSINENVEETLINVLVAIRQNEYLQAWYPEQQGFPAMKVVGKHPASK